MRFTFKKNVICVLGVCGQMHGIVLWKHGEGWERNGDKIEPRNTSNLYTWQVCI